MFKIEASGFTWTGKEEEDFCLHGNIVVTINNHVIDADDTTVSASALYF